MLNENKDWLLAEDLDVSLDNLQNYTDVDVVVIYEACESGSFVPRLLPPEGKQRIVITSSKSGEAASFADDSVYSFSYQFWSSVILNGNLYSCRTCPHRDLLRPFTGSGNP